MSDMQAAFSDGDLTELSDAGSPGTPGKPPTPGGPPEEQSPSPSPAPPTTKAATPAAKRVAASASTSAIATSAAASTPSIEVALPCPASADGRTKDPSSSSQRSGRSSKTDETPSRRASLRIDTAAKSSASGSAATPRASSPHVTLPGKRHSPEPPTPASARARRQKAGEHPAREAQNAKEAELAAAATARKKSSSDKQRNRTGTKSSNSKQQAVKQTPAEDHHSPAPPSRPPSQAEGSGETPPAARTFLKLKLKRPQAAPLPSSAGEDDDEAQEEEDEDEEEKPKLAGASRRLINVVPPKKRKLSPSFPANESGDDYQEDEDDQGAVKVVVKPKKRSRRMESKHRSKALRSEDEDDDEDDRLMLAARHDDDDEASDAVSNLSSELSEDDTTSRKQHKKSSRERHRSSKAKHSDKYKSDGRQRQPKSAGTLHSEQRSGEASSSSHVKRKSFADEQLDAPLPPKKLKPAAPAKPRSATGLIPLPRKAGGSAASAESSTSLQSATATAQAQAALKKPAPPRKSATGMAMFDSLMKFSNTGTTPTTAAKASQAAVRPKVRPPGAKPAGAPGTTKPGTGTAPGSSASLASKSVRPMPRPLGYVSTGTPGASGARSGTATPTGAQRGSLQAPKRGANGEHVTAAEMAEQREIEMHRNANPTELFDLLADQETVIEWEEECKRQARADPHNHKIIRPSRPEGVSFLVAKIKRERAAANAGNELQGGQGPGMSSMTMQVANTGT